MKQFSAIFTPGIRYMFVAALAFVAMHVLIKLLNHIHVFEILFFRSAITSLLCMMYLRLAGVPLKGHQQKWLFLRAGAGIIAMSMFFVTLQRMPLGASVSLKYLSPIFTAIFAVIFLKERVRPVQWGLFLLALGGVFLLKGFDTRVDSTDVMLGVCGAVFAGLVYVIIRRIGESEHPMVIVNYFMASAAVLAGLGMMSVWHTPSLEEWGLLLGIGILGFAGQVLMTKSFQAEAASRVAQVRYIEVVYSLLIGLIWFDESYTVLSFLGIVLILGSMLTNMLVKQTKS